MEDQNLSSECAICLLPLLYPVKLPCSHEFCFLCIKGLRSASAGDDRNCALCRTSFSFEQISQTLKGEKANSLCKSKWHYESKKNNEWWKYDERTAIELEDAFISKKDQISISIAGFTYIIDFVKMHQYRESHPNRARKIRREESEDADISSSDNKIKVKGIAGLRVVNDEESQPIDLSESLSSITISDEEVQV